MDHLQTRVTEDDVMAAILHEETTFTVLPDGVTTICQLTLDNGYTVNGQSACVDPANFDQNTGRKYSYDDAMRKVWPLLGFRLADLKYEAAAAMEMESAILGVGDRVNYFEHLNGEVAGPLAGIVASTPAEGFVNVSVLDGSGQWHARPNALVLADFEPAPDGVRYFVRPIL